MPDKLEDPLEADEFIFPPKRGKKAPPKKGADTKKPERRGTRPVPPFIKKDDKKDDKKNQKPAAGKPAPKKRKAPAKPVKKTAGKK